MPGSGYLVYRFSGFRLDPERGLLRDDGTDVQLRAKSFELLLYLVARAGRVVSKDELLESVWNGQAISEDSLTQCVHDIRRALSDTEQGLIRTVPRRGYLFVGDARREGEGRSAAAAPAAIPRFDRPALAVLAFLNLSGDPTQDYFADGMAEEIIIALTRMKWLFVVARNSSFSYKGRNVDSKTVSRELGVRYVLEGSVRKSGGRVRVSAQLVDAENDIHLWAEHFDGLLEDIFDLQDQVTARVVGAIAPRLELAEIDRARHKSTESLHAHDYYLRALAAFYRITRTGNDEALASLYRAIEIDPSYATAYGFAARCYVQRNSGLWIDDQTRDARETERLARCAVELGQDDAVALSCAAFALSDMCGDPKSAVICVDKALSLSPSLASAWLYSAWVRVAIGEIETALAHAACAKRLSPNDPQGFSLLCCEGVAHFCAADYRQAIACAEAAMQIKSDYILAHCLAIASAARCGLAEEATGFLRRAGRVSPSLAISRIARVQIFHVDSINEAWIGGLRKAGMIE